LKGYVIVKVQRVSVYEGLQAAQVKMTSTPEKGCVMALPIFVIGKNRSGTKWLSNTIANHEDVACIQREGAGGILETNMFENMPRIFGSLSIEENNLGFLVCFSHTIFFILTGLDKKVLYSKRVNDYAAIFRLIMDLYAQKEGKKFWLQKSNSLQLAKLLRDYPDAKFIIIQRGIEDNIRSTFGLRVLENEPTVSVIRDMFSYFLHRKTEQRFQGKDNVMVVKYEEFKGDKKKILQEICAFLDIQYYDEMLVDRFRKNTSFGDRVSRDKALAKKDVLLIRFLSPFFEIIPWHFYHILRKIFLKIRGYRGIERKFIAKTFEIVKIEYGWDDQPSHKLRNEK
jgi:hypothetical protein